MCIVLQIIDWILYCLMAVSVLYFLINAIASLFYKNNQYGQSSDCLDYLVVFPAYKEDLVVREPLSAILSQDYPKEHYHVVLIADKFSSDALEFFRTLPITLLDVNFENSSKAKALNYAMNYICKKQKHYDKVVILDSDNIVENNFLNKLNDAFNSGICAIQAHRMAKNSDTAVACLDAVSEEINNSIYRKGHTVLGLSSSLIGSGMAFDFDWFAKNVCRLATAGEDKELEILLLKDRIFVAYLDDVPLYDQKVNQSSNFYNQRRRWIATQFYSLADTVKYLPKAIANGNIGFVNKLFQWMLLPKTILLAAIAVIGVIVLIINPLRAIKWAALIIVLLIVMLLAIPARMLNRQFFNSIWKIPHLAILMIFNLFRLKGANKTFIHTQHNDNENSN